MAALSVLRAAKCFRPILLGRFCNPGTPCLSPLRLMSSERRMMIKPSGFTWHSFKNNLHYYLLLGIIPLGSLIFFVNVFIGPPELAEIPEGYEPKHWEYYNHPIKRFFARYIYPSHQQNYEMTMHMLQTEHEKAQLRMIEKKVRDLMRERGDYQAWYFVPYDSKYVKRQKKVHEEDADRYVNIV